MTEEEKKRILGLLIAGSGGALIGGGILPGLIYKNPGAGSRAGWAAAGGVSAILATLALMYNLKNRSEDPVPGAIKSMSQTFRNAPYSLIGSRPTRSKLEQISPMARAMYGVKNPGSTPASVVSLFTRNWKRAMPDITGIFGSKSPGQIAAQQRGDQTPQSTLGTAGSIADITRGVFNLGVSGGAGFGAGGIAAENYRSLNRMKDFVNKLRRSGISTADLNLGQQNADTFNRLLRQTESSGVFSPIKQSYKDIKNKWSSLFSEWFNKNKNLESNPVLAGRESSKFIQNLGKNVKLQGLKANNGPDVFSAWGKGVTKLTRGQKLKVGTKGILTSLVTLAALGGIQSLFGANKSYDDYVTNVMNTPAMEK